DVLAGDLARRRLRQKGRQRQELLFPRLARLPRYGAPGFRRYIDQFGILASCRAGCEVEAEAKLSQEPKLKPGQGRPGPRSVRQKLNELGERRMRLRVRVALG